MKTLSRAALVSLLLTALSPSVLRAETTPQVSSPSDLVNAFHSAFGAHQARAVHAKGIILEGVFTPSSEAAQLTKAFHLQREPSKVTARFSNFTGIPDIPDNIPPANPRGLALKFTAADGASTDLVCHSFNGFPTATTDQFREFLLAIAASGPEAAKPTSLDRFLDSHPIAKTFLMTQSSPASYATISYFGVNAFKFINKKGEAHFVRYQLIPMGGEKLLSAEEMSKQNAQYLGEEIKTRVAAGPLSFRLYAQLAEPGDVIDNPSVAWPDQRRKVLLGTLKITKLASNTSDADKALSYNPGLVPEGIETADPMLTFRAASYPISVAERR